MIAVNLTALKDNLESYMDRVTDECETLLVTTSDNKNIIMISEDTYNNLMENLHLMENKENYDWLMESKEQLEKGEIVQC